MMAVLMPKHVALM